MPGYLTMSKTVTDLIKEASGLRFERPKHARRLYSDAVSRCRQIGTRRELIQALKGLGQIERDLDHGAAALPLYEEAVALCRQEGDALLLAHTVRHLGDIHQDAGRPELAEPCYVEALTIYRSEREAAPLDLANAIRPLATLKEGANEWEQSQTFWQEAKELYARANVPQGVRESSRRLALLAGKEESP